MNLYMPAAPRGVAGILSVGPARVTRLTNKRDGKVTDVTKATVMADGKTMNIVDNDKLHGTTTKFVALKQ